MDAGQAWWCTLTGNPSTQGLRLEGHKFEATVGCAVRPHLSMLMIKLLTPMLLQGMQLFWFLGTFL